MRMILIFMLIISLLVVSLIRFSAVSELHFLSSLAHQICIDQIPPHSKFQSELKALVCAENFTTLSATELYAASGLIHLFVVSGAHLVLIERMLHFLTHKFKWSRLIIFSCLFCYAFICDLNAPICRALVSFSLNQYLYSKNFQWPTVTRSLMIGLITLLLNPAWVNSLSLQMSWLAAFATNVSADYLKDRHIFFRQLIFFMFLYPTLMFMQALSLSTVLFNLFFAPLLEYVLFPLALLTCVLHPFYIPFDKMLSFFNSSLRMLEVDYTPAQMTTPANWVVIIWFLIFALHFITHAFFVYRTQRLIGQLT
jgi:ComEC/Rec2-related protein